MELFRQEIIWECFGKMCYHRDEVRFITRNNQETSIKRSLLRFFSPLFNNMLGGILHRNQDILVHLPQVEKATLVKLFDLLRGGVSLFPTPGDILDDDIEDIRSAAQMLGFHGLSLGGFDRIPASDVFGEEALDLVREVEPLDFSMKKEVFEETDDVDQLYETNSELEEKFFADSFPSKEREEFLQLKPSCQEKLTSAGGEEAKTPAVCGSVSGHSSVPPGCHSLPPTPEYSPPKAKERDSRKAGLVESDQEIESSRSKAPENVKNDHKVVTKRQGQEDRDTDRSVSKERSRGTKRGIERISENRVSRSRDSGSTRSALLPKPDQDKWKEEEGESYRSKRKALLPKPEEARERERLISEEGGEKSRSKRKALLPKPELREEAGPPISSLPELQYIYENKYHNLCRTPHRRIDLCPAAPVHEPCGRRHSYAMDCQGSWMSLNKFESVASRWPTSKMIAERMAEEGTEREERKRRRQLVSEGKNADCCLDWNFGICDSLSCKRRHRCSFIEYSGTGDMTPCLGRHKAREHREDPSFNCRR